MENVYHSHENVLLDTKLQNVAKNSISACRTNCMQNNLAISPKKLQEAINSDDESKQRWENFQQRMETQYSFNLTLRMIPKDKQPTEQNTNASVEINYARLTVEQIHQTIQNGLQQGQLLAKKMKSKKTTTKDDKEFIKMAHNASQSYIELANRAFKDESALSGENSEKFQTLEEVGWGQLNVHCVRLYYSN